MEIIFSVLLGLGLATACGFKVFVPFLIVSIASLSGHLELAEGFGWVGSYPALIVFLVATILEILAYYIPVVDNFLDTISTPITIISGSIVMLSCVQGMSPLFTWTLSIIVGGTVAGGVKVANTTVRAASTTLTGGSGNFIVNTVGTITSVLMSILSIFLPILAVIFIIVIFVLFIIAIKKLVKLSKERKTKKKKWGKLK